MIVAVCIDDNNGMMFNGRRQSQDRRLLEHFMRETVFAGKKVWVHSFSAKLFSEYGKIEIADNFLDKASAGEICFVENQSLKAYEERVEEIIVYKWNRRYPADFRLDLELQDWHLIEKFEFAGNSHERITRERYHKQQLK